MERWEQNPSNDGPDQQPDVNLWAPLKRLSGLMICLALIAGITASFYHFGPIRMLITLLGAWAPIVFILMTGAALFVDGDLSSFNDDF